MFAFVFFCFLFFSFVFFCFISFSVVFGHFFSQFPVIFTVSYLLCSHVSDVSDLSHRIFARSSPAVLARACSKISVMVMFRGEIIVFIMLIITGKIIIFVYVDYRCDKCLYHGDIYGKNKLQV